MMKAYCSESTGTLGARSTRNTLSNGRVNRMPCKAGHPINLTNQPRGNTMKILGEFEYVIGSHFLPALFNGDVTGLDDTEDADLERFEKTARFLAAIEYPDMASAHWDYDEIGEGFARDRKSTRLNS